MDSTRNTPSMAPQFVVLGVLAISIVLLLWAVVKQADTLSFGSAVHQGSGFAPASRQVSKSNAEGLAIYFDSEHRPVASTRSNAAGLGIYHSSERSITVGPAPSQAGWTIYRKSELSSFSNPASASNDDGLAIYRDSERNLKAPADATLAGWDTYRASEQGR